jgi:hypothetical protein
MAGSTTGRRAAKTESDRDQADQHEALYDAEDERIRVLLEQMDTVPVSDPRRERVRAEIVEISAPIARAVARRYGGRGKMLTSPSTPGTTSRQKPSPASHPCPRMTPSTLEGPVTIGRGRRAP